MPRERSRSGSDGTVRKGGPGRWLGQPFFLLVARFGVGGSSASFSSMAATMNAFKVMPCMAAAAFARMCRSSGSS